MYLNIPLHALYARTYIVHMCGTGYEPAIPVAHVSFTAHITTKLHELKTALDPSRGQWRAK